MNPPALRGRTRRNRKQRQTRKRNLQQLIATIKRGPCVDCKKPLPVWVLEFDHLANKTDTINRLVNSGRSKHKVLEEVAKCEVVCANCHKHREYLRGRVEYQSKRFKNDTQHQCMDCGDSFSSWVIIRKKKVCHNCWRDRMHRLECSTTSTLKDSGAKSVAAPKTNAGTG